MDNKLPPIPQKHYDTERERFDAESYALDLDRLDRGKCPHTSVKRISATQVQCDCGTGWIDNGLFILKNNKIVGVK